MLRTEGTYEFREAGITNVSVGEVNYGGGLRTPVLPNLQIRESGASAFAMRKI